MAKIYETKEDFERDKLTEQAQQLRNDANSQSQIGGAASTGGLATLIVKNQHESKWISFAAFGLITYGLIESIRSWFTAGKAHTLELERDRMGPAKVIMPPDIAVVEEHKDCQCHSKLHKHAVSPKTLLEQAERSGFPVMRE